MPKFIQKAWHWLGHLHLAVWIYEHTVLTAIGASIITAVIAYIKAASASTIGLWAVGVGILVLLILIFTQSKIASLEKPYNPEPFNKTSQPESAPLPVVFIDIVEGVVAQVRAEIRILLHVRVRNGNVRDLEVNDWLLNLFHDGKHWKYTHKQPLPDDLRYEISPTLGRSSNSSRSLTLRRP